jgi:hypothetical protein
MRMTAASLQGLGPLAPVAQRRALIQLPTGLLNPVKSSGGGD